MAQPAKTVKAKEGNPVEITQIQALAWLERGAPIGSPEQDWLDAETRLAGGK